MQFCPEWAANRDRAALVQKLLFASLVEAIDAMWRA
jgi:hypothetical protein